MCVRRSNGWLDQYLGWTFKAGSCSRMFKIVDLDLKIFYNKSVTPCWHSYKCRLPHEDWATSGVMALAAQRTLSWLWQRPAREWNVRWLHANVLPGLNLVVPKNISDIWVLNGLEASTQKWYIEPEQCMHEQTWWCDDCCQKLSKQADPLEPSCKVSYSKIRFGCTITPWSWTLYYMNLVGALKATWNALLWIQLCHSGRTSKLTPWPLFGRLTSPSETAWGFTQMMMDAKQAESCWVGRTQRTRWFQCNR